MSAIISNSKKKTFHGLEIFVFSKELCLEILKRRENYETFTEIYNELSIKEYYPNSVSSYIHRFYKDCNGYGIDTSHIAGRRSFLYLDITDEKYKEMYEDLKNNPKKYNMKDFFARYNITDWDKIKWLVYDCKRVKSCRIKDIRENFIYNEKKRKATGWKHFRKLKVENANKKHLEIERLLNEGYEIIDIYKKFGFMSPDCCATTHRYWLKNNKKEKLVITTEFVDKSVATEDTSTPSNLTLLHPIFLSNGPAS